MIGWDGIGASDKTNVKDAALELRLKIIHDMTMLQSERDDARRWAIHFKRKAEAAEASANYQWDLAEKWRIAATVLCGAHIGVPQDQCPVCRAEAAEQEVARLKEENDRLGGALSRIVISAEGITEDDMVMAEELLRSGIVSGIVKPDQSSPDNAEG